MALSDDRIYEIAEAYGTLDSEYRRAEFARAIEAEVRKDDEALIRNFVAAIKLDRHDWEDWPEDSRKAFEALHARLEGKK